MFTPTLTGLGERAHLLSPAVDLRTHIQDVVAVLTYEDLEQVVLVGHSYGGMVISGVAEQAVERLTHLVYLDAYVPTDGSSVFSLQPAERAAGFEERARTEGDGWRIPPLPLERFGATADEDVRWAAPRLGPQPLQTFTQPIRLSDAAATTVARTYIWCTEYQGPFRPFAEQAQREPGWRYRELTTGHDAMITAPYALVDVLLEVTQERAR